MTELPTVGRSTLADKQLRFIGFTIDKDHLQTGVYQIQGPADEYVLTLSKVPRPYDVERIRSVLGILVPGQKVAPYAQRGLIGPPDQWRWVLENALPSPWYWYEESPHGESG